jgi:NADPH2:quinone reductase
MKAVWYTQNGEARDVLVFGELPTPEPKAGEVRVKLRTSGVNPSDVKSRKARPVQDPEIIPHSDGAGVIDAVGDGVSPARLGERVWVWNGQWQRPWGTACEYITVPDAQAVRLPDHIDDAAGACLGIPALTAMQAVFLAGDLTGKTVLVTGASSAVGHYIAQLATLAGAHVIGTVGSEAKAMHAKKAGVRDVIFYKTESVPQRIHALTNGQGVDCIIDMDFSTTTDQIAQGALKAHGTVVCYGSNNAVIPVTFRPLLWGSITLKFFLVYDLLPSDRERCIARLTDLLERQQLRHTIGQRFRLDQAVQAHECVEAGQTIGQVVIDIA